MGKKRPTMRATAIDRKGRVLIPAKVRRRLKLKEGDIVLVETGEGEIKLRIPARRTTSDNMFRDFREPAHIEPALATREQVEKLEEENWAGSS